MAFNGGEMSVVLLPASEVALDANTRRAIESAYRRGAAIDLMEWRLSDKGRFVSPPSFGDNS